MVLPPPPADDAPRAVEARWFDALKFALRLSNSGLLLLVDHARQESLGELVEALAPDYPELDVHTDVRRMLELPHGSTVVLVPRAEDADWLNINRPLFAQRELRVVLFCDTPTTIALAQRAVDFFDWISHRVDCPQQPPRFAVERIRTVLAVRAPGIIWTGGNLQTAFAAARPHGHLLELSATMSYRKMLRKLRDNPRAWIAWKNVDSHFRLRRVRWAHAEAGHRTRAILIEPTVASPGWWKVHGRMTNVRVAREQLEQVGVPFPGRAAALLDFAPEALARVDGANPTSQDVPLYGLDAFQGTDVPWTLPPTRLRQLCLQEFSLLNKRIAENQQLTPEEAANWAAWFPSFSRPAEQTNEPWLAFAKAHRPSAMEVLLARTFSHSSKWLELIEFALQLQDTAIAKHWASQSLPTNFPGAERLRASFTAIREGPQAEELFLRKELYATMQNTQQDTTYQNALIFRIAELLGRQGKWRESEEFIREGFLLIPASPLSGNLIYKRFSRILARSLREQHRHAEAEVIIRQAIDAPSGQSNEEHIELGLQFDEWASLLIATQREFEAESALNKAFLLLRDALGIEDMNSARVLINLTNLLCRHNRPEEAEKRLRQALTDLGKQKEEGGIVHAELLEALSSALADQGKYIEAEAFLGKALHLRDMLRIGNPERNELMRYNLARLLIVQGRYEEAEELLRGLIGITAHRHPALRYNTLRPALFDYGQMLWKRGLATEAALYLERAVEILREHRPQTDPLTFEHLNVLAKVQAEARSPHAQSTAREALTLIGQTSELADSVTQDIIDGLKAIAQTPMDPSPT